jgi:hypothetical protein
MTLRRYSTIKPSRGTVIPGAIRAEVRAADQNRCVPHEVLGMEGECLKAQFGLELDHVRAGGTGMKSRTSRDNLLSACNSAHREKTNNGRKWRPIFLEYIERRDAA